MRRTDKTLLEQLQISDIEIQRRKELLGLNPVVPARPLEHQLIIQEHLESIVAEFQEQFPGLFSSIGITETGPDHFDDIDFLIRRADERMYTAKAAAVDSQPA